MPASASRCCDNRLNPPSTSWAFGHRLRQAGLLGSCLPRRLKRRQHHHRIILVSMRARTLRPSNMDHTRRTRLGHLDNQSKRSDNPTRRHTSIGNLSPIDYETRHRHSQRHNHHNHPVQKTGSGSDCRRDGIHYSVGRKMLLDEFRLRVGGVPGCRPRRQYQKQARAREPAKRAALARFEDDERARVALDGFPGRLDRHAAGHDLHDRSLANLVVAHRLATLEIKDDGPTLRRTEEHARHPSIAAGHARSIRSRLTRAALLRRGRKRHKIPTFHRP